MKQALKTVIYAPVIFMQNVGLRRDFVRVSSQSFANVRIVRVCVLATVAASDTIN